MVLHILSKDVKFIKNSNEKKITENFFFIFDSTYNVPKTSIYILLRYQDYFKNLLEYTKFFKLKEEQFFLHYDSLVSSYMVEISVNMTEYGIEINIQGISTKIVEVCELFLDFIFSNITVDREKLVISKIKKNLIQEKYAQSYKKLFQGLKFLHLKEYEMAEDLLENLDIKKTVNIYSFNYKIFVFGNIKINEVEKLENKLKSNIKQKDSNNILFQKVKKGNYFVRSFDISNNACGIFFYSNKSSDLKNKIIGTFIINSVNELFFDQLRTNEEFGYVVSANIYSLLDHDFIYFLVQSERDTIEIKERILKFITFTKEYLKKMTDDEFLCRKESLIDFFSETHKNLYSHSNFLYRKRLCDVDGLTFQKDIKELIDVLILEDVLSSEIFNDPIIISTEK